MVIQPLNQHPVHLGDMLTPPNSKTNKPSSISLDIIFPLGKSTYVPQLLT